MWYTLHHAARVTAVSDERALAGHGEERLVFKVVAPVARVEKWRKGVGR